MAAATSGFHSKAKDERFTPAGLHCRQNITREFDKLRRLLPQKRHFKKDLCLGLSVLLFFNVGHDVRSKRTVLSLAWREWFSYKGKEEKIYCCELALSSEISRRRLADYVKSYHQ